MTFDEWLNAEYMNRDDRQSKYRMSSVRELMEASWNAARTKEREACAKVCDQLDVMSRDPMVAAGSAEECAEAIRNRK